MNRSNSFVNSLKWWNQNNNNNNNTNSAANSPPSSPSTTTTSKSSVSISAFGSTVAVQKLRESKWFVPEEQRIFCAVVECGFICEVRSQSDENVDSWFGVVLCKTAKDNKPKPETIEIVSMKLQKNGSSKIFKMTLNEIWSNGLIIRINNFNDREKTPHPEKDIKNQIAFARKVKQCLWHNSKHFAFWCRYGSRQQDIRRRQMSECVKWGSVGMNAGMLLLMNKQKSHSASK